MKRFPPTAGFIWRRSVSCSVHGRAASAIKLISLILWLMVGIRPLHAHGGGEIKLAKEPIGPYKLTVWLNPSQPQTGKTMHITIGVLSEDDSPVLDAAVTIEMINQATGQTVVARPATAERSTNKLYYETDFPAPGIGTYEISIQLTGENVTGQVTFPTEVQIAQNANWLVIGFVGIGVILVVFLYISSRNVDLQIPGPSS